MTTTALSGPIDVHLVTHEQAQQGRRRRRPPGGLTIRRRAGGFAVAAAGLPLATALLASLRGQLSLPSDILTVLLVAVAAAITGGFWPGITAAVAGFLLLNYYFTEPYHTFAMSHPDNVVALAVFAAVAAAVSAVVGLAARRSRESARAAADAELLFHLAGNILRGEHALPELLERLRETFGQESVTLLERRPGSPDIPDRQRDPGCWQLAAAVGGTPCTAPDEGDTDIPVGEDLALVLRGRPLPAASQRIAEAFAAQAAAALRQQRLAEEAEQARPIAAADRMRTALLTTLSHDLRSPLAAATAACSPGVQVTAGSARLQDDRLAVAAGSRAARRGASCRTRRPSSSGAASKPAGSPAGTGSGTDQCSAASGPSSSWARSQTVMTRSPSSCVPLMCRGRRRGRGSWCRCAASRAPGSMASAGCVPAEATGRRLACRHSAAARWERAELAVHTNS
jgi:two-component system sensor histidine kinase KdpD